MGLLCMYDTILKTKTLVLQPCVFCKSGATALAQCLHANTALENLDINGGSKGNIGDAGDEVFGKALAANSVTRR
jgi:hypothetical protein